MKYIHQKKKNQTDIKKEQHRKLRQAAERIKSGKVVSEVIIADKMADLYIKYGVKPVDKDKTVQKIHATKTPSRTQKKILERYLSKNK